MSVTEGPGSPHDGGFGTIRRRHIIFVEAYDPRGAEGYFDFFRRTCDRFGRLWPFSLTLQPLEIDSPEFAHWRVDLRGSNWQVATRYDFLRLEGFIRPDMARPLPWQILNALHWLFGDFVSGVNFRIFRASWRFGLQHLYLQLVLVAWLAAAVVIALIVARAAVGYLHSVPLAIIAALMAAIFVLVALRPLVKRSYALQLCESWTVHRKFARGQASWLDSIIDAGARRVLAVAKANEADELAVIGHSSGCVLSLAIMARAMELDPGLGRSGPRLVVLNLGSIMPGVALHPAAQRMREIVSHLATAPRLAWIECQSALDIMCFAHFDPVDGIGVHVEDRRCNPVLWEVSFKEMIAPEDYPRFRRNYFRTHFQYIMGGDRPAAYDYILLVGGPLALAEWPKRYPGLMDAFLQNEAAGGRS